MNRAAPRSHPALSSHRALGSHPRMRLRSAPPSARGFSLAELMVVLAIAAVLISVALPDIRSLIRRHQLDAAVTDLFNAVDLLRSEAIARGARVHMVPAQEGGASWRAGWVVFVDRDGDGRPGRGDDIIAMHGPVPDGVEVTSVFTNQKVPYYVAYNGSGRSCSDTSSLAARWGTLSVKSGDDERRIRINMLGRARICNPARDGPACEDGA